jgi:hypothetical protein
MILLIASKTNYQAGWESQDEAPKRMNFHTWVTGKNTGWPLYEG